MRNKDKTARLSLPAPSEFVAQRRAFLPAHSAAPRRGAALSESEVSICADILTFARTHFERKP
jgi:hypothetical protein